MDESAGVAHSILVLVSQGELRCRRRAGPFAKVIVRSLWGPLFREHDPAIGGRKGFRREGHMPIFLLGTCRRADQKSGEGHERRRSPPGADRGESTMRPNAWKWFATSNRISRPLTP